MQADLPLLMVKTQKMVPALNYYNSVLLILQRC